MKPTQAAATALKEVAQAAACTLGIEARAYFGSRPWAEVEPALSRCWSRNYGRLKVDWVQVVEFAYTAWSYQRTRLVLAPDTPCGEMAS